MRRAAPVLLVVLGLLQIAGDLTGLDALKGVAAATGASPAPKVFSSVKGLETFASKFFIELRSPGSCLVHRVAVTAETYSRIRGPYNRRNVYGAAFAYAPLLPPAMRDAVMSYALCGSRPLLRELDVRDSPDEIPSIVIEPGPGSSFSGTTHFPAPCR